MSGFGDLVLKWPHNNPNWNPTCDLYDVLPREALPSEVHDHGSPEKKRYKGADNLTANWCYVSHRKPGLLVASQKALKF